MTTRYYTPERANALGLVECEQAELVAVHLELHTREGSWRHWQHGPGDDERDRRLNNAMAQTKALRLEEHLAVIERTVSVRRGTLAARSRDLLQRVNRAHMALAVRMRELNAEARAALVEGSGGEPKTACPVVLRQSAARRGRRRERRSIPVRRAAGIRSGTDPGDGDPHPARHAQRSGVGR